MKVHLLSAYFHSGTVSVSERLVNRCNPGNHTLTGDPAEADLILFAETYSGLDPYFLDVVRHPVFRRFPEKCVLYHISDITQTLCRTISPSINKYHPNANSRRLFSYIVRIHGNQFLDDTPPTDILPRYLFSFIGDPKNHQTRPRLLALQHPEAHLEAVDGPSTAFLSESEREL